MVSLRLRRLLRARRNVFKAKDDVTYCVYCTIDTTEYDCIS
jgi:hypothetical protein